LKGDLGVLILSALRLAAARVRAEPIALLPLKMTYSPLVRLPHGGEYMTAMLYETPSRIKTHISSFLTHPFLTRGLLTSEVLE